MSKLYPGAAPPEVAPDEQLAYYLHRTAGRLHPVALARVRARARELDLDFADEHLRILAALDNPARVQWFLDEEVFYNNDHATEDQEETCMPPRGVLETGRAHCFEGALFAYAVNYLHGYEPRWMLLEGSKDVDHNLIVYRDRHAVRWGCNAHSGYPHLNGRPAEYYTLRALAETYYPHYYSGYTNEPRDVTLVGYSEPYDLTTRFGVAWMASAEPLWDMYYTFVDDSWRFYRLFTDSTETHLYPLITALERGWIVPAAADDPAGRAVVNPESLPPHVRELWERFWQTYNPDDLTPRGPALELEQEFFGLTDTTPIDLTFNAEEFGAFLEKGYRVEDLIHNSGKKD